MFSLLFGRRLLWLIEHVRQTTFATVLSIEVIGHEDARAAYLIGTLASQTRDLAVLVHFVVLEHGQLYLLLLVLDLLRRRVVLLLTLATASSQTQHQMKRRLFLYVIVGQSATVLELLAGKDQTLLIGRYALFVLNFSLNIFDRVTGLDLILNRKMRHKQKIQCNKKVRQQDIQSVDGKLG